MAEREARSFENLDSIERLKLLAYREPTSGGALTLARDWLLSIGLVGGKIVAISEQKFWGFREQFICSRD